MLEPAKNEPLDGDPSALPHVVPFYAFGLAAKGKVVVCYYDHPPDGGRVRLFVAEDDHAIRIVVSHEAVPTSDGVSWGHVDESGPLKARVTLSRALGQRVVIDASRDAPAERCFEPPTDGQLARLAKGDTLRRRARRTRH